MTEEVEFNERLGYIPSEEDEVEVDGREGRLPDVPDSAYPPGATPLEPQEGQS